MCKFIICHLFALLLISASTQAVNWRVEFLETYIETSGSHEGQEYLSPGIVTIEIYLNNTDRIFTGWSTPFKFSGSVSLNGAGKKFTTTAFKNLWDMGTFEAEESWDGDLSTPDQYNFSGIGLTGYQPGMGEIRAFVFQFYVVDSGEDCATPQGLFCIDSGDFSDDTNDWLFDPALPFIGETCYSVKSTCCAGTTSGPIVDTPDKELVGFIGEELTWDFSEEPDPQL